MLADWGLRELGDIRSVSPIVEPTAVSIILPTQRARPSLVAALRSALVQAFSSFEIILVDDSPAGAAVVDPAAISTASVDPRLRLLPFHQSRGCAAAKNAGLRAARGEWVCYLDDDNEYRPGKLAAQHALAESTGAPVVLCGLEYRVGRRRRPRQVTTREFRGDDLLLRAIADTNVLFHRRDIGVQWDESLGTVDDACFFQSIIRRHGVVRVPNVPEPLVVYHAHPAPRANTGFVRFYGGQRCLLTRWSRGYSRGAQRVLLLRSLVAFAKYRRGGWLALARNAVALVRAAGWSEARYVANAAAVKLPVVRKWVIT